MKQFCKHLLLLLTLAGFYINNTDAQIISTIAGNGTAGYAGDGFAAILAEFNQPVGILKDRFGNVYIADFINNRVRKINSLGIISTIAGNGLPGFSGDGGPATSAKLNGPTAMCIDAGGNIFIADYANQCIRKIDPAGIISTVAGIAGSPGFSGDGGIATSAKLNGPEVICIDAAGNIYIADAFNQRIRKINTSGIISTVAGNGSAGYTSDGIPATSSSLNYPVGITIDPSGNLLIADQINNRIRKVNTSGIISTVAGTGFTGYSGDGGAATAANLNGPYFLSVDSASNDLYFTDRYNHVVRKINSAGVITTIAGSGVAGYSGDGGAATLATLNLPEGIIIDNSGNILIAENNNNIIRKVSFSNQPPTIIAGHNQSLLVCETETGMPINSLLSITDTGAGQTETWVLHTAPVHGTILGLPYSATSPGTSAPITPIGVTYQPTTGYVGFDSFKVWVSDGISTDSTTILLNVNFYPNAGVISGIDSVCPGQTVTLTESVTGGFWSTSSYTISYISSSGDATGLIPGRDTIAYTVSNICGIRAALFPFNVKSYTECRTGINELTSESGDFKIFPNPANDEITIFSENKIEKVEIFNMVSQKVYSGQFANGHVTINLDQIASGNYFIKTNGFRIVRFTKL